MLASREVLIDTNLLLVLVVGAIRPEEVPQFKRTTAYTVEDFYLLDRVVGSFQRVVVTPHVLTEVSNLTGQLPTHLREYGFRSLGTLIGRIDERYVEGREVVADPAFSRLGLTDAAILRSARRELTVLTDDLQLYLALERRSAAVINFNHVRTGAWSG